MEEFIEKDGKKLRYGYTTGSCAAAAAKAAAWMLLTGKRKNTISLVTPKGIPLSLQVEDIRMEEAFVSSTPGWGLWGAFPSWALRASWSP